MIKIIKEQLPKQLLYSAILYVFACESTAHMMQIIIDLQYSYLRPAGNPLGRVKEEVTGGMDTVKVHADIFAWIFFFAKSESS